MAKEMGIDRAPIEFQFFYFSHVLLVPPTDTLCLHKSCCKQYPGFGAQESDIVKEATDQPKIV